MSGRYLYEIIQDAINTNTYISSPTKAMTDKHNLLLSEFKRFLREFVCNTDNEYTQLVDWIRTTLRSMSTGKRNDAILVLNTEHDIRRVVYHILASVIGDPLARQDWYNDCIEPKDYNMYVPSVYVDIARERWTDHRLNLLLSIQRQRETSIPIKYRRWQYTSPVRVNICISLGRKRDDLHMFNRDGFIICNGHPGGRILNRSNLFLKMERLANDSMYHRKDRTFEREDTPILSEVISHWLLNTDDY